MDTDNTQDIIRARFKELPPEVQKAITTSDLSEKFDKISKKYSLRIDQSGALQTETLLVMLGLEKPTDYIDNLVKNAEINKEVAKLIGADVNTEILGSIRSILEDITSKEGADEPEETIENPAPEKTDAMPAQKPPVPANPPASPSIPSQVEAINSLENPPPFIDRLLTGVSSSITETVVKSELSKTATPSKPASIAPSTSKIDPYREPIG